MSSRKLALALVALLALALAIRFLVVWPQLPDRIASHFNGAGKADGWMSRNSFILFTIFVEGGVVALLLTTPMWVSRAPQLINMPHRDYWLAEERRPATVARLGSWMAWMAVMVAALSLGMNELIIRANLGDGRMPDPAHKILLWGFLAMVALYLVGFVRAFRRPPVR